MAPNNNLESFNPAVNDNQQTNNLSQSIPELYNNYSKTSSKANMPDVFSTGNSVDFAQQGNIYGDSDTNLGALPGGEVSPGVNAVQSGSDSASPSNGVQNELNTLMQNFSGILPELNDLLQDLTGDGTGSGSSGGSGGTPEVQAMAQSAASDSQQYTGNGYSAEAANTASADNSSGNGTDSSNLQSAALQVIYNVANFNGPDAGIVGDDPNDVSAVESALQAAGGTSAQDIQAVTNVVAGMGQVEEQSTDQLWNDFAPGEAGARANFSDAGSELAAAVDSIPQGQTGAAALSTMAQNADQYEAQYSQQALETEIADLSDHGAQYIGPPIPGDPIKGAYYNGVGYDGQPEVGITDAQAIAESNVNNPYFFNPATGQDTTYANA